MIYWCKKCNAPVFDKGLHSCTCEGKLIKISEGTVCNPVFKQERKLLERITDCNYGDQDIWYLGASKYFINEKIVKIPYVDWYKAKKHLLIADYLKNNIEIERDYSNYIRVVNANESYLNQRVYEAEQYIVDILNKYKGANYIPTVSFSGGKDSTVVSRLVMDALQDNSVIHMFGDTTLEFKETYSYVLEKFRQENPRVPLLPSETENDFFKLCKVFGPPSQHERWCCTIFKTSNLNKEYDNLPGNSLTFLGIRRSESVARAGYERTQEKSKISSQVNAMPIIEWADYDVWLYILAKNLLINDCYQYGYKRVGCWCCPNNSDWSMMLTEIYHPEDMQRWKDMVYDFAERTGKTDIDDYYEEGRWKTRRGASGLKVKNVTIADTPCNLSDRARNIIIEKKLQKDVLELFKPFGDLKIVEKKDATYVQIFDNDKAGIYRKICTLILTYGTTVIKVLPEERVDVTNLVTRIKCQMRKYQFCIRCTACDSTCPHGAIDTIHGNYKIDENKCHHCKHCIAKFYNGCIMCEVLSSRKEKL
ncbi:MAG: phosphoadenosine phosphosulfate reductase family protein [Alphaproteobacteria bacterium]|nr:phosphoadenosine phosphosulfate reductase family protein [Alphaproteobacteria bacterium]